MSGEELKFYFNNIRKDFPILNEKVNGKQLVYADNSATTQKPMVMVERLANFYLKENSNVHRGIHTLSERATEAFEQVRKKVAHFLNSDEKEIIFTSGTTQAINSVVLSLAEFIEKGDEIILTEAEHHANLVPWQEIAKAKGAKVKYIPFDENYRLDMKTANDLISDKTKIVAFPHISNVLGTVLPAYDLCNLARKVGAYVLVDGAQSCGHMKIDVKKMDCDFYVFSAHKMCGPTGVGVIYGKEEVLNKINPFVFGGNMIDEVGYEESTYGDIPFKFEAGTANIADVIAFGASIDYLQRVGMENIEKYEELLTEYFLSKFDELNSFVLLGPKDSKDRSSIFSFYHKGIHAHDFSYFLDNYGIAVRSGHHCVMPFHSRCKIKATSRVSLYFYNTFEEVDYIIDCLKKISLKLDNGA